MEADVAVKEMKRALLDIPGATSLGLGVRSGKRAVVVFVREPVDEAVLRAAELEVNLGVPIVVVAAQRVS